jgi:hypothetical protein
MIHAFEPLPDPFEQMQKSHKNDKRFRAWNMAAGDETGIKEVGVQPLCGG